MKVMDATVKLDHQAQVPQMYHIHHMCNVYTHLYKQAFHQMPSLHPRVYKRLFQEFQRTGLHSLAQYLTLYYRLLR